MWIDEVAPDDVFYEVGANIGMYSCLVGNSLDDGPVVAFEPHPENLERLRHHLETNDVPHEVRNEAVGNDSETIELILDGEGAGSGLHSIAQNKHGDSIEVPVATLNELVRESDLGRPTVMYVDAEGVEVDVRGTREVLDDSRLRFIDTELHVEVKEGNEMTDFDGGLEDLASILHEYGYETEIQFEEKPNPYLIARR